MPWRLPHPDSHALLLGPPPPPPPPGPCVSTDTACSSSLVSAHQAHSGLLGGETVAAVAAGVNAMLLPVTTASISGLSALSPVARCKTFDSSADGYGRGEGFSALVISPQPPAAAPAAAAAASPVALVCGSAVNQDGRSSGLTAPNGPSQSALVREVLGSGGLTPGDLQYLATHGTGAGSSKGLPPSTSGQALLQHWSHRCSLLARCRHPAGRPH